MGFSVPSRSSYEARSSESLIYDEHRWGSLRGILLRISSHTWLSSVLPSDQLPESPRHLLPSPLCGVG